MIYLRSLTDYQRARLYDSAIPEWVYALCAWLMFIWAVAVVGVYLWEVASGSWC